MASATPKHHHKIYRIALYGRSSSGKSCLLTALAMPRMPHPDGLSCTWIPVEVAANDKTPHAEQLRAGKTWMQSATKMLSNGELLPPTPVDTHLSVRYDFTTPDHRTFQVELVDYSGELVHTETSDSELAKRLRKQFSEMDGIIILAEAPSPESMKTDKKSLPTEKKLTKQQIEQMRDLNGLCQTFSLLRGEKQEGATLNVPVVLAVTKWDRYSNLAQIKDSLSERAKLKAFFAAHPAHKSLGGVLKSSITPGNFQVFPVSALGPNCYVRNSKNEIIETPTQTDPLLSFGLEEPFAWLIQQRDTLDLQEFKQNAQTKLSICQHIGKELLRRFPTHSKTANEVHGILSECRRKQLKYSAIALASVVGLWFVAETSLDMYKYRKYSAIAEHPSASEDELFFAEKWFYDYSLSPWFRHAVSRLKLSRDDASKAAYAIQMTGQAMIWQKMESAATQETKKRAAQEYLVKYPHGPHAADAQTMITQVDAQQEEAGYGQGWQVIQNLLTESNGDPEKLQGLLNQLADLEKKYPTAALQYKEERKALQNQLSNRKAELSSQLDWGKFLDVYNKAMNAKDWDSAGKQLMERSDSEQLKSLKEQYRQKTPQKIADEVKKLLVEGKFDPAKRMLETYANLPAPLKDQQGDEIIAESQKQYDASRDEHLYNEIKNNPNDTTIKAYLETAPLGTMRGEVEAYKEYLAKIDPNAMWEKLRIRLDTIRWLVSDGNQKLTVLLDNRTYIEGTFNAEVDKADTVNKSGGNFEAKPEQTLYIVVKLEGTDWVFNDSNSSLSFGITPKALVGKGYLATLKNNEGKRIAELHFSLLNYPEAPNLPEWRPMK